MKRKAADYRWRLWVTVLGLLGFGLLLVARLIDVQLVKGQSLRVAAEQNRLHTLSTPAERGLILDRYEQPLAWNVRRYFQVSDTHSLYPTLSPITRENALPIMATDEAQIVTDWVREYRWPEALSHLLGYVGKVTRDELTDGMADSLTDQVGKMGLELVYQRQLRGKPGKIEYEINALGKRQKRITTDPALSGTNITTTLDPYLSEVAYRALGSQKGALLILDGETGNILTMVSSPAFNANMMTQPAITLAEEVARKQQIQAVFNDARQLFFNRGLSGNYPPGSIFKLITALAGLETEVLKADTIVIDEGVLKVGEYEYGNWYYRQYGRTEGPVDIVKALARSNDIYFYKAAEWIGPERLAELARLFGLGKSTLSGLPGEAAGLVPDPAWKEAHFGERWFLGNTYHYGIGQGDLLVTPLQIAQLVQALSNNGMRCQPSLVGTKPVCTQVTILDASWQLVLKGMLDACSPGGTAYPFFAYNQSRRTEGAAPMEDIARGAIACKTGTAEFGAEDARGYRKTHGWFVGIVHIESTVATEASTSAVPTIGANQIVRPISPGEPVPREEWLALQKNHPLPTKLVFVSLVESDEQKEFREGSADAAPVVKKIIDWMYGEVLL